MFLSERLISECGWQAFERLVARLLVHKGFTGVRVVGASGDKGADIIARADNGKRWLLQAKYWAKPVPVGELQRTVEAMRSYRADLAVMVVKSGVDERSRSFQAAMLKHGISLSIWEPKDLVSMAKQLPEEYLVRPAMGEYQEAAIELVRDMLVAGSPKRGMVVMATGLGKTFVAAEAIRRARESKRIRVLVLAHTNQLILQLEKAFWPFIGPKQPTAIWTEGERPADALLEACDFVFASRDSVATHVSNGRDIPNFNLVLIDECHHAHSASKSYRTIISSTRAGTDGGPQLLGLTATPFMTSAEARLEPVFGDNPLVSIDMIYGLTHGFLSRLDYRLYTDNINWEGLKALTGESLSPRAVNRAFFIKEWDDGVIEQLQETWREVQAPKSIVFCGTIEHAVSMKQKINARGFCKAEAIYSGNVLGRTMSQYERNLVLADFESGHLNVLCTVDIFNEGIDVPDVNIVVFNRVTHSRRIFIQQLGRGLRVATDKDKAIALDFAQDIRRYAAGIRLRRELEVPLRGAMVALGNKVVFRNAAGADPAAETFLKHWLQDVEAIESAGDDEVGILQFPPPLP